LGMRASRAGESTVMPMPEGVLGALPELADSLVREGQPVDGVLEALGSAAVEAVAAGHEHSALEFGQPSHGALEDIASGLGDKVREGEILGLGSSTTSPRVSLGAGASRLVCSTGAVITSATA